MSIRSKASKAVLALTLSAALVPAGAAAAQSHPGPVGNGVGSVFACDAPGGRQEAGAAIGAVIGGLLGSRISDNERTLGAVAGAAVGAGAGSWYGCRQQRQRAERAGYGAHAQAGYAQSGVLSARSNVNVRSGPGTEYGRVGRLSAGQTFQAGERLGDWIGVVENGRLVGYVHAGYVG